MAVLDGAFEWFADQRGMPVSFLKEHGLRLATDQDTDLPWDGDWIAIPYYNLTGLWYHRYRNLGDDGPKYFSPKGATAHLYNPLGLGPDADQVWIVEGELDTLAAIYLGAPAIGVPGAFSMANNQEGGRFRRAWTYLYEEADVVLALDPDEAGRAATNALMRMFPTARVFELPEELDWNDWLLDNQRKAREVVAEWMSQ